jgi:hypothetical protein
MLTLGDLLTSPARLGELADCDVLIAATGGGEVIVREPKAVRPDATMVFMHETIQMMKAERAGELAKLRRLIGPKSVVVPLRKKPTSIWDHIALGRSASADIVVNDPAISAVHANFALNVDEHPVSVQDVGSSNGTFLNRNQLQPHTLTKLMSGDCVRFGQTVFYYISQVTLKELLAAPSASC